MRILLRLLVVCALLGGLGYGSYALGRHVLSNYLFGNSLSGSQAGTQGSNERASKPVTRQIGFKGARPSVQVQVLPAEVAGPGPEPPPTEVLEREALQNAPSGATTANRDDREPAPRRSRRGRRFDEGKVAFVPGQPSQDERSSREGRYDREGRRRYGREERSTRRRRRYRTRRRETTSGGFARSEQRRSYSRDSDFGSTRAEAPRISEPRRESARQNSPVPQPEGGSSSSGGESPVPQPE